jgi:small subunit ribosomal protein S6
MVVIMEKTQSYSVLVIIDPEKGGSDEEVKALVNSVIKENTGEVVKENMMGKRPLAYPINKKTEGVYYEVGFTALPGTVAKISRQLEINTDILRTLISKEG